MPITRGAKKKLRQDIKRTKINLVTKRKVKKLIKEFKLSPSDKLLRKVNGILDNAKKKKIYHANKVARLKSRLSKVLTKKTKVKESKTSSAKKKFPRKKKTVV